MKLKLPPFTETQKSYLEAIKWLVSEEPRAIGRSFLMAVAFIEKALENPGSWVFVFDHMPTETATLRMMYLIRHILNGQGEEFKKRFVLRHKDKSFSIEPRDKSRKKKLMQKTIEVINDSKVSDTEGELTHAVQRTAFGISLVPTREWILARERLEKFR